MVGLYKIKEVDLLLDCLNRNIEAEFRTHDEYQLTDGLMQMIESGVTFDTLEVNNWFDCGKKDILLETNKTLLNRKGFANGQNEQFTDTIIIPPVSIGVNCDISASVIGPHVTIGDNSTIKYSILKDSIIGSYTYLQDVILTHSIVGHDASIKGHQQSLNIGDNTDLDFT